MKSFNEYYCYRRSATSQLVRALETLLSRVAYFFIYLGGNLVFCMVFYLPWKTEGSNNLYYELNESPMSLSSIFLMLFRDGLGRYKSAARRMLVVALFTYLLLLSGSLVQRNFAVYLCVGFYVGVPMLFGCFRKKTPSGCNEHHTFKCLFFDAQAIWYSATLHSQGAISLLTLPFNVQQWMKSLQCLNDLVKDFLQSRHYSSAAIQRSYYLLCLFYVPIAFVFRIIFYRRFSLFVTDNS